jgi:adenine phosphoribosyltransferase
MNLKKHIRSIQDYPKKGILFRDITTLIKNSEAFNYTIDEIVKRSQKYKIDKIAAMESRGFVFASAVSYILKKPFILLRKKNKLPAETHSVDFKLEYGTATMELHKDSIQKNDSVLLVDDLIATGGTAIATGNLINQFEANIYEYAFLIDLPDLGGANKLRDKNYNVYSLMQFDGE